MNIDPNEHHKTKIIAVQNLLL